MKTATYTGLDGKQFDVEYDETAPCRICGYPVMDASMGGTNVCPWCDCGVERPDKTRIELQQLMNDESTVEGTLKAMETLVKTFTPPGYTAVHSQLTKVCEHCFQPYPDIYAPKHKDGKCNEICVTCGCHVHPNTPCSEVIQYHNHVDSEYFRLLQLILDEGRWTGNRTGIDTLAVFGAQAKFDVDLDAFPILTTKKVWFKGIVHELLWFIRGDTNIKYLVDNDVHIWDEWAYKRFINRNKDNDTQRFDDYIKSQDDFIREIKSDKWFAGKHGGLGEGTYGGMWRAFPYGYEGVEMEYGGPKGTEIKMGHVDQLKKVLDKLKTNPLDRRMIVSAWHPYWVDHCSLPPCHCFMQFNTQELTMDERRELYIKKGGDLFPMVQADLEKCFDVMGISKRRLNLLMLIRSNDMFLGAPFNLTSYSLLLAMVAQCVGMETGVLTYTVGDCHLYSNHMEQVKEQLTRTPMCLPKLWLNPEIKDLFSFKYEDIKLIDYKSHPAIKGDVAV